MAWISRSPLPSPRYYPGLAPLAAGDLHAVGGSPDGGNSSVANHDAYTPGLDTWTTKASMPTARWQPMTRSVAGVLYAIGGSNLALVNEAYDPITNTWSSKVFAGSSDYGSSCVIGGQIYTLAQSTALWAYTPNLNAWTQLVTVPGLMDTEFTAADALDSLMIIAGGQSGGAPDLQTWLYDPSINQFSQKGNLLSYTSSAAFSSLSKTHGLLVGGYGPPALKATVFYNLSDDTWQPASPLPTAAEGIASAVVDGNMYVVGGYDPGLPAIYAQNVQLDPSDLYATTGVIYASAPLPVSYAVIAVRTSDIAAAAVLPHDIDLPASAIVRETYSVAVSYLVIAASLSQIPASCYVKSYQSLPASAYIPERTQITVSYYTAPPPTLDVSLSPVIDAFVWQAHERINYGDEQDLMVGFDTVTGAETRSLLRFDLSGLAGGLTLRRAVLRLLSRRAAAAIGIHSAQDTWTELGVTWDNQPAYGSLIDQATPVYNSALELDVTSLVKDWYAGSTPTRSLALVAITALPEAPADVDSREFTVVGDRPQLVVTYDNPSGGIGESGIGSSGTVRQASPSPIASPPHYDLPVLMTVSSTVQPGALNYAQPTIIALTTVRASGADDMYAAAHVAPGPGSDIADLVATGYVAGANEMHASANISLNNVMTASAVITINNVLTASANVSTPNVASSALIRSYADLPASAGLRAKRHIDLTAAAAISQPNLRATASIVSVTDLPAIGSIRTTSSYPMISMASVSRNWLDASVLVRAYEGIHAAAFVRSYVSLQASFCCRRPTRRPHCFRLRAGTQ